VSGKTIHDGKEFRPVFHDAVAPGKTFVGGNFDKMTGPDTRNLFLRIGPGIFSRFGKGVFLPGVQGTHGTGLTLILGFKAASFSYNVDSGYSHGVRSLFGVHEAIIGGLGNIRYPFKANGIKLSELTRPFPFNGLFRKPNEP
jgi:hypothetical protein